MNYGDPPKQRRKRKYFPLFWEKMKDKKKIFDGYSFVRIQEEQYFLNNLLWTSSSSQEKEKEFIQFFCNRRIFSSSVRSEEEFIFCFFFFGGEGPVSQIFEISFLILQGEGKSFFLLHIFLFFYFNINLEKNILF